MSAVGLSRNGAVATLTLDRPEARNALEPAMMVELRELVTALPLDGTRVIILTGAGDIFCAGADIDWMRRSRDLTPEQNVADAAVMRSLLDAIDACPLPVIAAGERARPGRRRRGSSRSPTSRSPSRGRASASRRPGSA